MVSGVLWVRPCYVSNCQWWEWDRNSLDILGRGNGTLSVSGPG